MWKEKKWSTQLGLTLPIIQAGMAGGPTTPELVAEVSNHGGLGTIGVGYLSPEALRSAIKKVKEKTNLPFGVNVFIPSHVEYSEDEIEATKAILDPIREELGADWPQELKTQPVDLDEQLQVIVEEGVRVLSFTFGLLSKEKVSTLKEKGLYVVGTATALSEAKRLEETGVDAIVLQGIEAGGQTINELIKSPMAR